MLDRLRGRAKDDPALEEVRRKTAARLAAIVGLTSEAELDTELDPNQATDVEAAADETEAWDPDEAEVPLLAIPARAGEDDDAAEPDPEHAVDDVTADEEPTSDASLPADETPEADESRLADGGTTVDAAPDHGADVEPDVTDEPAIPVALLAPPVALAAGASDDAIEALSGRDEAVDVPAADPAPAASDATSEAPRPTPRARRRTGAAPNDAPVQATEAAALESIAPSTATSRSAKAGKAGKAPAAAKAVAAAAATPGRPAKAKVAATPASVAAEPPAVTKPDARKPAATAASPRRAASGASPARGRRKKPSTDLPAACPTCGRLLDDIPTTARRCISCRQRIVPKRLDGRTVLLAEAVVPLFEAERRRLVDGGRLMRECGQWLRLAALVGASPDVLEARARAVAAHPTREAVASAQKLYAATVDRACRAARQSKDWRTLADLRFRQARAYHRASGAPIPPEPAVVALHRDAIDATLRAIAEISREAQLAAAVCCDACSSGNGQIVRISVERKEPSLPHADCPVGLCGCRWELRERRRAAVGDPSRRRGQPGASTTRKAKTATS